MSYLFYSEPISNTAVEDADDYDQIATWEHSESVYLRQWQVHISPWTLDASTKSDLDSKPNRDV